MWDFDCYNYWFWNALGSVYYAEMEDESYRYKGYY